MKARYVHYERTKTEAGTHNNESVGIRIELVDDEKAEDALLAAKAFVSRALGKRLPPEEYEKAKRIIGEFEEQAECPF